MNRKSVIVTGLVLVCLAFATGWVLCEGHQTNSVETFGKVYRQTFDLKHRDDETGSAARKAVVDALTLNVADSSPVVTYALHECLVSGAWLKHDQFILSAMQTVQASKVIQQNDKLIEQNAEIIRLLKKQVGEK